MLNIVNAARRIFLGVFILILVSCSSGKDRAPVEKLERPPQMVSYPSEVQGHSADPSSETYGSEVPAEEKKPNQNVRLMEVAGSNTKLEILEPYDQAWALVAKALKYDSAFEVTDRNRDGGVYYVNYYPDEHGGSFFSKFSFLTGGSESEGSYNLRLVENGLNSEVTAEMIVEDDFDDELDSIVDPDTGVEQFLTALYKALREI